MWAQLIKTHIKDGREAEVEKLLQQLRDAEQPDSGLVRTLAMRDQEDANSLSILVVSRARRRRELGRTTRGVPTAWPRREPQWPSCSMVRLRSRT